MLIAVAVLILIAVMFPGFMRLVTVLAALAILYFFGSIASHAGEPAPKENETNAEIAHRTIEAFSRCNKSDVSLHRAEIHAARMLGQDVFIALVADCAGGASSYIQYCQMTGRSEKNCYGDIRLIVEMHLKEIGEETH